MRVEAEKVPCTRDGFHVCGGSMIQYADVTLDDGTRVKVYPGGIVDVLRPDGWRSSWSLHKMSEAHDVEGAGVGPLEGHVACPGCEEDKEERLEMTLGLQAGVKTCDDCTEEYAGPAYYTFPASACRTSDHDGPETPHAGCTGNLCPRCAGPHLGPDRADDPRRPARVAPEAPRIARATRPDRGWRSPNPTALWASNDARGRIEREAASHVYRDGVTQQGVGRLILARGFYAANDDMLTADALTLEIEARKLETVQ